MLISPVYPAVVGATSPKTNSGHLQVKGWEAVIGWKDNKKDFVLLCYYINNKYHAERYIVYQPNDMEEQTVSLFIPFFFCSFVFLTDNGLGPNQI